MANLIDFLQHQNLVWQGTENAPVSRQAYETVSTGFDDLDKQLRGGLPKQGVVDIQSQAGIGELRLLLPYLRGQTRMCAVIHPPAQLNAHALFHQGVDTGRFLVITPNSPQEALWAAEQCLKSGACDSVLLWHGDLEIHQVKRLQLAAQTGQGLICLLRSDIKQSASLPVCLSLKLMPHDLGLTVQITKRRGGWAKPDFILDMSSNWPELTSQSKASKSAQVVTIAQALQQANR
ncbi:translesion DNA synthesis-associated protein ImuA [Pseudoalteromonas sp. SMS1]|uniref:translesion DNA synthesis-associated protein ImuA n=1 Tax=Pseudoalteromonas sp. SMS1 TaxID=2908894 RepID=UPI001F1DEE52|nr:translesion DNA synthesis-associated protein ImuA [Pseudoalteromonas sp. SMS1]MCF2856422.1 translesion DNA synthesis-associated protein ImuA [Pseudoalteromonas sp. SMS1]